MELVRISLSKREEQSTCFALQPALAAMSILPKDAIQVIAESIGINNLPDDVASALAPDVEYRMREIIQEAMKCMLHSKRTILTTDDVNSALQLRNIEPLYGFASGGPLRFKRALGNRDLFYIDDGEIDSKYVIESPLPKAPLDTAVVAYWLAIEGVQPAIPENTPSETSFDSRKADIQLSKKKDEGVTIDIKLPVKHVLSRELQLYFEKITELIITGANSALVKAALRSLATDSGLHPLVPYLTQFVADEVTRSLDDVKLLLLLMHVVRSLLLNPHIHIEPYLHQLMPCVITCLVAKRLGGRVMERHWELRDYTANLIAFICRRFGHVYHNLQSRVTRTLLHTFLDPRRAMTQHYGAIKGLTALGPRVVGLLILPNLETYLQLLTPEMSLDTQTNEVKRYEAIRVYETLLNAVGLWMSWRLNSYPAFLSTRVWPLKPGGKIATSSHKADGISHASSLSEVTSTSTQRMVEAENSQIEQKNINLESVSTSGQSEPIYDSSISTSEFLSAGIDSSKMSSKNVNDKGKDLGRAGKKDKANDDKAYPTLAEAWKENTDLGAILASLIELFGEAVLPFIPKSEASIFI